MGERRTRRNKNPKALNAHPPWQSSAIRAVVSREQLAVILARVYVLRCARLGRGCRAGKQTRISAVLPWQSKCKSACFIVAGIKAMGRLFRWSISRLGNRHERGSVALEIQQGCWLH